MNTKKFLSFILTFAMLLSFSSQVFASETTTSAAITVESNKSSIKT